jgi:DNA-binding LytR/AlgR family response regulator
MAEPAKVPFEGRRLLVVEDDYFIAVELAHSLERLGAEIIGPVGSVADALQLLCANDGQVDRAVLDIHLGEERVFPVADALMARRLPFVFLTGYDPLAIPLPYARAPRCEKPVDVGRLARVLAAAEPMLSDAPAARQAP